MWSTLRQIYVHQSKSCSRFAAESTFGMAFGDTVPECVKHSWLFHIYGIVCAVPQLTLPHVTMVLCEHSLPDPMVEEVTLQCNAMLNCCRQFVLDSTFSPTFIILPFTSHKLANIIGSSWAPYTEYVSIVSIVTVVTTRKHCDCVSTASIDSSQKTSFQFFSSKTPFPFLFVAPIYMRRISGEIRLKSFVEGGTEFSERYEMPGNEIKNPHWVIEIWIWRSLMIVPGWNQRRVLRWWVRCLLLFWGWFRLFFMILFISVSFTIQILYYTNSWLSIPIIQAACGGSYNQNLTYWSTTSTTPCTINICKCQEEVVMAL